MKNNMNSRVDFENISIAGLESSPVSKSLAGLRANESRYYKNKYNRDFTVSPANESKETLDYINKILLNERNIRISSRPLETSNFTVDEIRNGSIPISISLVIALAASLVCKVLKTRCPVKAA